MNYSNVVDCHLHVYWPEKYPFPNIPGVMPNPGEIVADPETLKSVLRSNGVTHALLVQPSAHGEDNRPMLETIASSSGRMKGIAVADISIGAEEMVRLKAQGIVGLRLNLYSFDNDVFEQPGIVEFFQRCADNDMIVEVFATPPTWPNVVDKLRACPARMVIEHMGWPVIDDGIGQPAFQHLLSLAGETDSYVKLSCAFRMSEAGFPYNEVTPYVEKLLEVFGPDRCVWGSDWPMLRSGRNRPFDYANELAVVERWLPDGPSRNKVLWTTPARLFGLQGAD